VTADGKPQDSDAEVADGEVQARRATSMAVGRGRGPGTRRGPRRERPPWSPGRSPSSAPPWLTG
jgi:hypothetical protein